MQNVQTLKTNVINTLDMLPFENLRLLSEFASFLRLKIEQSTMQQKPVIKLGGLWANTLPITEDDITEARQEMWGNLGEIEI
ncbi:MAG: hypothetical protein B6242_14555 [Anaerolineaceae bacterium 4572_78]|nr:MAG: hypothetical protein B6242_14555 [Anaerolineaceae bacterium 4572_78]